MNRSPLKKNYRLSATTKWISANYRDSTADKEPNEEPTENSSNIGFYSFTKVIADLISSSKSKDFRAKTHESSNTANGLCSKK